MRAPTLDIRTRDPDEFIERLSVVTDHLAARTERPREFRVRAKVWALPGVAFFSVKHRHLRVLSPKVETYYSLTLPRVGGVRVVDAGEPQPIAPGELHILDPQRPFDLRTGDSGETLVANIDRALIERQAFGERDRTPKGPLLASRLERQRAGSLRRYLEFLWSEIQRDDSALARPLVARRAVDMIAALAVDAAPLRDPEQAPLESLLLSRAEEYLAAHITAPVSAGDVAESLGVSVRSLSRAFHARHAMGPMGFVRERRFEAARRALAAASRESATVTKIALRHGFTHLGRFSVEYRKRFGVSPSETLARRAGEVKAAPHPAQKRFRAQNPTPRTSPAT